MWDWGKRCTQTGSYSSTFHWPGLTLVTWSEPRMGQGQIVLAVNLGEERVTVDLSRCNGGRYSSWAGSVLGDLRCQMQMEGSSSRVSQNNEKEGKLFLQVCIFLSKCCSFCLYPLFWGEGHPNSCLSFKIGLRHFLELATNFSGSCDIFLLYPLVLFPPPKWNSLRAVFAVKCMNLM